MHGLIQRQTEAWWLAAVAALLTALLLTQRNAGAGGLTADFEVTLMGQTQIGGASVEIDLFGKYAEPAGAAPCVGGSVVAGTITVSAGDTRQTGVFVDGETTLGCVPGKPGALYIDGQGVWEQNLAPFFIEGIGTQSGGMVSDAVADITSLGGFSRRGELNVAFSGRVKLHGDSTVGEAFGPVAVPTGAATRLVAVEGDAPSVGEGKVPSEGREFEVTLGGPITFGKARLALEVNGFVQQAGNNCTYGYGYRGNNGGGKLSLKDADDSFDGEITSLSARACPIKGAKEGDPRAIEINFEGVIEDARSTPFSGFARGQLADGGRITGIEGILLAYRFDRFYSDTSAQDEDVETLGARVLTFGGGFTGKGRSKGLAPIDQPEPEPRGSLAFKLGFSGSDGGHDVSIDTAGVVQGQLPFDRTLFLRFTKATVTADGRTYDLATKTASLQKNLGGEWTLTIIGGLNKPAKPTGSGEEPQEPAPVGVLITRLQVSALTATELLKGGSGDVAGRIASLKIQGSRLTPEVSGELTVTVKK